MSHSISGEISSRESLKKALQSVTESKDIDRGVLRIEGPEFSGNVGIRAGVQITGATVDGMDETGLAAVAKLLGVKEGTYEYGPTDTGQFETVDQSFKISLRSFMKELKSVNTAQDSAASTEDVPAADSEPTVDAPPEAENEATEDAPAADSESTEEAPAADSESTEEAPAADSESTKDAAVVTPQTEEPTGTAPESAPVSASAAPEKSSQPVEAESGTQPKKNDTAPKAPHAGGSFLSKKWVAEQWLEENKKSGNHKLPASDKNGGVEPVAKGPSGDLSAQLEAIPTPAVPAAAIADWETKRRMKALGPKTTTKADDSEARDQAAEKRKKLTSTDPTSLRGSKSVNPTALRSTLVNTAMGFSMVALIGAVGLMTYHKSQEDNVDKMLTNARFALKYQMYDQVLKDANAVIDVCQTKPEAYVDRGFAYLAQNQQRYALSDFEKALTFNPNDTKVLIGHGQALLAMSMYPQAEADFKKAISLAGKEPEPYRQLAKLYVAQHDFKKATQYSQKALQLAGNNATADDFETIAAIQYGAGNFAQAAASYEAALQKDPHRQPDLIREGECYRKLGNPAKALEAYNRAIILDPASAASYFAVGQCYMDMKKYSRAAASFTAVVTRKPQDRDALANRATCYMELKQYGHAIDDFDALLKLNPNDTAISTKRQMAVAKMSTTTKLAEEAAPASTPAESSTDMKDLTEKLKTDEPGVVEIARRMISNGETEGAVTVLAMCVRAKPNDASARRYLAHALSDTGQAATAVQQFDVLLKISMLTGDDRLTYARALESAGRIPDALRQLKILTLVRPSDDQVWTELVQTYLNANMPDAAKLAANEAMTKVQTEAARESINALINGNGSNGNTNTNTPKKEIHVRA